MLSVLWITLLPMRASTLEGALLCRSVRDVETVINTRSSEKLKVLDKDLCFAGCKVK